MYVCVYPEFVDSYVVEDGGGPLRWSLPMVTKKRGYSRAFTPRTDRRIKREIDRVPPTLDERVQAKLRQDRVSLRALTLTLWRMWADGAISVDIGKGGAK